MLFYSFILLIGKVTGILEYIRFPHTYALYINSFYATKLISRYQCMELCTQFTMCKAMTFSRGGICYLHDRPREPWMQYTLAFGTRGFFDRSEMAKYIVDGACLNHNCSLDTMCLPLQGAGRHACVLHEFPTFVCPLRWLRFKKKCYRPIFIRKNWQQAKDYCFAQSATLTEIPNSDVQTYVNGVLVHFAWPLHTFQARYSPGGRLYWTALTDQNTEGKWIWNISGSEITQESFVAWATPRSNSVDNDCVGLSLKHRFNWLASNCSEEYFFVCEI